MRFLDELRRRWWLALIGLAALVLFFGARIATFYTDILWFSSIDFLQVFWTLLTTQFGLGLAAGVTMTLLVAGNLLLARRLAPTYRIPSAQEEGVERYRQAVEPYARPLLLTVAVIVGVLSGLSVVPEWPRYVLWANAVEFGQADPQFGRDLGYFVFILPFHALVNSWLFASLGLTILLTAIAHYLFGGIRPQSPGQKLTPQVNVHLSALLAALAAVRAWGFVLDQFLLSYSQRGQVTGLSYTDVNAQLRAFQLLAVISAVCVVLFLANIWVRGWTLPLAGVGILVVAGVVLAGVYPAVIQRLQVDPQELPREREFIARNLELTRFGFGLRNVDFQSFPANAQLSDTELRQNARTLQSVRLWDPATLQNTYAQLQELRPYYDFRDVDIDRYVLDDELQQVMISVREISERDLPSQTWQNERLVYTHGYGLVSSAVSTKSRDGQPVFLVNDIPPQGVQELEVADSRIYFGENPPSYSIVKTDEQELDYPLPDADPETTVYDGEDGVGVGSPLRRLAFAFRFAEPNIVLSSLINDDSRILFKREIKDRVASVAPYLKLDHDPYPVAVDGGIKWIIDAYTTSDMLPYSERVDLAGLTLAERRVLRPVQNPDGTTSLQERSVQVPGLSGQANYIRNSVKAVVDAHDGTVTLYVLEPDDPIIQAWQRVFPDSFTPVSEASDELLAHFRYPEDMFRVQAAMFQTYHIQEADQFYTKEDAWDIPLDAPFFANQSPTPAAQREQRPMRPYYLLMRLPGEQNEEFALIQPFTPVGEDRNNMIAWLAGRSDGQHYGELKAYVMPPNKTVFGPEQIQARINQDDPVSEQITLWNQSGSSVIFGNLLVIPVEDSLLYVQPLFLRAEQSDIPELRKTVMVFGDQVVMEDTLTEALQGAFGEAAPTLALPEGAEDEDVAGPDAPPDDEEPAPPPGDDGGQPIDPQVAALIDQAVQAFAEADRALRDGDLGAYQERTRDAERLLEEAQGLLGGGSAQSQDQPAEEPPDT